MSDFLTWILEYAAWFIPAEWLVQPIVQIFVFGMIMYVACSLMYVFIYWPVLLVTQFIKGKKKL